MELRFHPQEERNEWLHVIKPWEFALALRYTNIQMSGKLIPVIKLAKI